MSVDRLQERIRKLKNPTVIDFGIQKENIPARLLDEEGDFVRAYGRFCMELLEGLRAAVAAVRFSFNFFSVYGTDGLTLLARLLDQAAKLGYYVLLDVPEALNAQQAKSNADIFFSDICAWKADGFVVSSYIGTDGIKPYAAYLKNSKKSLFAVVRTSNKSAPELQDLLVGNRLAHIAQADLVNRISEPYIGRSGYCQLGVMSAATTGDSLRNLREKYNHLFLLVDGYDCPNANAKNCSFAFDQLGHGAAVCAGLSVTGAWLQDGSDGANYVESALASCDRIKKNLSRYITVL
jgi:orotidine-5'-phosphate decarboxylase